MSTLFKKLGKEIQEAQSKLATALYPKTSDTEFDTKRNELTRSQKNIKKLRKNVDLIVMTAEAQHVAQTRMCENLSRIANQGSLVIANCNAFDTKLDEAFKAMDTKRTEIQIAIDSYMEQYNELEKRIAERFNRLAQMDRADKDLKKAEHHKPTRTEEYRNSYVYWKDSFEALNQEIKRDISLLVQDAANFVEKIYPVIAAAQVGYFTDCVNGTQVLHAVTSKADLESVKSAPRVITPNASSAMYFHGRGQLPSTSLQTMPSTQVSSTAPPLPPHPQPVATATALYDFQSTNPNELSFKAGDKLNLISHEGPWWKAQLEGKEGNVPSNFLQIISS